MRLIAPSTLKRQGILGMNRRNLDYIGQHNARHLFPLVDNKIQTKRLAREYAVPTPTLRHVLETQHSIRDLGERLKGLDGFAIKPAKGAGGKGIMVIRKVSDGLFIKGSGQTVDLDGLKRHCSNILAGLHSLAGAPDSAIIEDLIEPDPYFRDLSVEGVPDIRVIIFRGIPVMAMLRLSTHASDGKANLHQGAIGVGLDLASGHCAHAVQYSDRVLAHPDTGVPLDRIAIPGWENLLTLAASCHDLSGLGYLGADLVVDRNRGPLLLELNARPGLSIQVANGEGLLPRLHRVEALERVSADAAERAGFAMANFARQPIRTTA